MVNLNLELVPSLMRVVYNAAMDDLNKKVMAVWGFRLRLERIKKKLGRIEALMQTEEFAESFNYLEKVQLQAEVKMLRLERDQLERKQVWLEDKIKLPNPFRSFSD